MNTPEQIKELKEYIADRNYKLEKAYGLPQSELLDSYKQDNLDRLFNGLWVYERDL